MYVLLSESLLNLALGGVFGVTIVVVLLDISGSQFSTVFLMFGLNYRNVLL